MLTLPLLCVAGAKRDAPKCQRLRADIRNIHARLRQPYRARQGERLKDKLWRLKTRYYKECR